MRTIDFVQLKRTLSLVKTITVNWWIARRKKQNNGPQLLKCPEPWRRLIASTTHWSHASDAIRANEIGLGNLLRRFVSVAEECFHRLWALPFQRAHRTKRTVFLRLHEFSGYFSSAMVHDEFATRISTHVLFICARFGWKYGIYVKWYDFVGRKWDLFISIVCIHHIQRRT